jgi:predicted O-methyltransferase YrrM
MKLKATPETIIDRCTELYPEVPEVLARVQERVWHNQRSIAPFQAAVLYTLAKPYNRTSARILEIGTARGFSAAILSEACPLAHITTLNPQEHEVRDARDNLKPYSNVTVVTACSWDYLANYIGTGYDLIFVDGDHKRVDQDMPWWDHLRPDGLMLFHDYSPDASPRPCEPVFQACNIFAKELKLREPPVMVRDTENVGMAGFVKPNGNGEKFPDPYYPVLDGKPYSIMDVNQLRALYDLTSTVTVPGAIVECGVGNGGSAFVLAQAAKGRHLWAFGSTDGVNEPDPDKDGQKACYRYAKTGGAWGAHIPAYTMTILNKAVEDEAYLHYHPGWFEDSFRETLHDIGKIAILHIDANVYWGTLMALRAWYPNVVKGGLVTVSAYNYWPGVKAAVDEYTFDGKSMSGLFAYDDLNVAWRVE